MKDPIPPTNPSVFSEVISTYGNLTFKPAFCYSIVDATFGLGYTLGPIFGGLLYSVGGFMLRGEWIL